MSTDEAKNGEASPSTPEDETRGSGGVREIPPNEDTDFRDKIIEERDQVIRDQENTIQQQEMAYFTTNMDKMVTEIPGGRRLVYLNHRQVPFAIKKDFSVTLLLMSLFAKIFNQPENIQKLLEVLEVRDPKLVVRLITSTNGSDSMPEEDSNGLSQTNHAQFRCTKHEIGVCPFLSFSTDDEGFEAERNIDYFIMEVLIPLCERTNAVVICTPNRACTLSMSFGKAASFLAAKYGGKLPFSVLAMDSASNYTFESFNRETIKEFYYLCKPWQEYEERKMQQSDTFAENALGDINEVSEKLEQCYGLGKNETKSIVEAVEQVAALISNIDGLNQDVVEVIDRIKKILERAVKAVQKIPGKNRQTSKTKKILDKFADQIKGYKDRLAKENSKADEIVSDLNPYIQNVIMVDGFDDSEGSILPSTAALEKLKANFLNHLTELYASVAIGTLRLGNDGWKESASLVLAKIPVLFINLRTDTLEDIDSKRYIKEREQNKKDGHNVPEIRDTNNPMAGDSAATAAGVAEDLMISDSDHSLLGIFRKYELYHQEKMKGKVPSRYDVLDASRMAYWHMVYHKRLKAGEKSNAAADKKIPARQELKVVTTASEQRKPNSKGIQEGKGCSVDGSDVEIDHDILTRNIVKYVIEDQYKAYWLLNKFSGTITGVAQPAVADAEAARASPALGKPAAADTVATAKGRASADDDTPDAISGINSKGREVRPVDPSKQTEPKGILANSEKENDSFKFKLYFRERIQEDWMHAHNLLRSEYFYSGQISDLKGLSSTLNKIVEKDHRLPDSEQNEGRSMLSSAWNFIDIGELYVNRYKKLSKVFYIFVLLSGIATVCLTVFSDQIDSSMTDFDANMTPSGSIIFYVSVVLTFVTALNAFMNPNERWRQIRHAACNLESAIWQYRTRTGPFKGRKTDDPGKAASVLKDEVVRALETLIGSSDIGQSTSWSKKYNASVYKHGQRKWEPKQPQHEQTESSWPKPKWLPSVILCWSIGKWVSMRICSKQKRTKISSEPAQQRNEKKYQLDDHQPGMLTAAAGSVQSSAAQSAQGVERSSVTTAAEPSQNYAQTDIWTDDHYSPLKADQYIEFRLISRIKFYKRRVPRYTSSKNRMSVTLLILTATGTILAYKQLSSYVSICAVVAAAITSWMEYNNIAAKIGRYNSTTSSIESHILWWLSLPEADRTVVKHIDTLVKKGEQVLTDDCSLPLHTEKINISDDFTLTITDKLE